MLFKKLFPLLIVFILFSCDNKKEQELINREKALLEREKQFSDKEADYQSLLKIRDSLSSITAVKDTLVKSITWPDSLQVFWNSKMVCRESNCNNYVIGDQRNEVWQFISDSTGTYANVINNNKLIRVFKGQYVDNKIILDFATDSTAKSNMKVNIVLDDLKKNVIKGIQTISSQNNCKATFSVELTPSPKK
ncbi:hypothetical protein GR160_00245 [Flavobacterium sp. Sd200]|uniref:hypothetical protein n=1 Tax=Flavobacterium TaxID=237 RepID=UPI000E320F47|nr:MULTISPECIES: hypothetical protein [Flavobacterium]MXN89644.1 hypothetical protein [Flavobacterium sp. Sd200]